MPLLSCNCLIKLNLCSMHFFRFQRTWFYSANQGCPRLEYQTKSTIKGKLRHSKRERGRKGTQMEEKRESSEVQKYNSQSFKSPTRKRGEKMNKIRELRWRNSSHIFEIIQNITQPPKKHMPKHAHIRYHSLPQNPPHLTILEGNA